MINIKISIRKDIANNKISFRPKFIYKLILEKIINKIKNKQKKILLDVGCGDGGFIKYIADNTKLTVMGTEIIKKQIIYLKKKLKDIKFLHDNIYYPPSKELRNLADIININGVNQIFDDQEKIIKNELLRLKRNGTIIITGQANSENIDLITRYRINKKNNKFTNGWNIFSVSTIVKILKKNKVMNIKIIKVKYPKNIKVKKDIKDPLRSYTVMVNKRITFQNSLPINQQVFCIYGKKG